MLVSLGYRRRDDIAFGGPVGQVEDPAALAAERVMLERGLDRLAADRAGFEGLRHDGGAIAIVLTASSPAEHRGASAYCSTGNDIAEAATGSAIGTARAESFFSNTPNRS